MLTKFAAIVLLAPCGAHDPHEPVRQVDSVTVTIPNPGSPSTSTNPAITELKLFLDVQSLDKPDGTDNAEPLTFSVSTAGGFSHTFTAPTTTVGDGSSVFHIDPGDGDLVIVTFVDDPPGSLRRYQLWFLLNSNFDDLGTGQVQNLMTGPETWTIEVNDPVDPAAAEPVGNSVVGGCLQTWVTETGDATALTSDSAYTTSPAELSSSAGGIAWSNDCFDERPPISLMLVLDKSGSMDLLLGSATSPTRRRIDVLRDAVEDVVDLWGALPAAPGSTASASDQVGVVFFNEDAVDFVPLGSFTATSSSIADGNTATTTDPPDPIRSQEPDGWTSIGDGVRRAAEILSGDTDGDGVPDDPGSVTGERKIILLMSDGEQNRDDWLSVNAADEVVTGPEGAVGTSLPGLSSLQIYTLTTTLDWDMDPHINQEVAAATGGFYVNASEEEDLRLLFLEMLQNFLRFNTVEAVMLEKRILTRSGDSFSFPVTGGTTSLTVDLLFNREAGAVTVELLPPGGAAPIRASGTGSVRLRPTLAQTAGRTTFAGTWTARVQGGRTLPDEGEPYRISVLADDHIIKTEFEVEHVDFVPGGAIPVSVRPVAFGQSVSGLAPGSVTVRYGKPGESLHELLLNTQVSGEPQSSTDVPASPGDVAFDNLEREGLVTRSEDNEVVLTPDGSGGYSGEIPIDVAGHYQLLFTVEGSSDRGGAFKRQQIRTAYVLPYPDPENTEVNTTVDAVGTSGSSTLNVTFTPMTAVGNRLGKWWDKRFWLRAGSGTPIGVRDVGDGTYAGSVPFTGGTPPTVALHFLDAPVVITAQTPTSVIEELLETGSAAPGSGGTVLFPDVNNTPTPTNGMCGLPIWAWVAILVVGIVLVLLLRRSNP